MPARLSDPRRLQMAGLYVENADTQMHEQLGLAGRFDQLGRASGHHTVRASWMSKGETSNAGCGFKLITSFGART